MRKTIRTTLPCPHCGSNIRFNEDRPKARLKSEISRRQKAIQETQNEHNEIELDLQRFGSQLNPRTKDALEKIHSGVYFLTPTVDKDYSVMLAKWTQELNDLQNKVPEKKVEGAFSCPCCHKAVFKTVTDRTIKLKKRGSKVLGTIAEKLG
jgi:transcription initiation factor IIE alpha subunit